MGVFLVAFAGFAALDWVAVAPAVRNRTAEYVCKPGALAALLVYAITLDPADRTQRAWFVAALAFSLAGDFFLMLDKFEAGLASFLVAHICYIGGFVSTFQRDEHDALFLKAGIFLGALPVAVVAAIVGGAVLRRIPRRSEALSVGVYIVVISLMVLAAFGAWNPWAAAGASLFFVSDALIAWNRFVRPMPWVRPVIMATYHLGQAGLVLSLTR